MPQPAPQPALLVEIGGGGLMAKQSNDVLLCVHCSASGDQLRRCRDCKRGMVCDSPTTPATYTPWQGTGSVTSDARLARRPFACAPHKRSGLHTRPCNGTACMTGLLKRSEVKVGHDGSGGAALQH